ncbi:lysis protein [Salmonella enterica]|nr:lysis protein [Salmonella enterica]EJH7438244.1 lysis protein [Salmonella enterica]EJH7877538.1 lysis protein [Salmonella enterica]EJI6710252.1 lysis protein [Salmonella enterica]
MTFNWKTMLVALLLVALIIVGKVADHYRDNATEYKKQRDEKSQQLNLANATIKDMQTRQRDVAALDAKYTKELADAKAENDRLRADVVAGKRQLQLKATCANRKASASGVDADAGPQLTADAELNYWRLRDGIDTVTKQLSGLQEYVREQCLK